MSVRVKQYNPDIILWAIERAGKDLDALQSKQNLGKLPEWLSREYFPTLRQLEALAKAVYVPMGYFFLKAPPVEELPITFFRSDNNPRKGHSLALYETVQNVKERQEWLVEFMQDQDYEPKDFVGSVSLTDDISEVSNKLNKLLGITNAWFWEIPTREASLRFLIDRIEQLGIFTSFSGVVNGNNTRPIDRDEFRGFALVNEFAPFVFVNANDAKSAQIFTLIHEVVHVLLGESAGTDLFNLLPADDPIERFCDQVAAEFLVPTAAFQEEWARTKNFNTISRKFKVSTLLLAKKAKSLELINNRQYLEEYNDVLQNWQSKKDKSESNDGNYYYTTRRRIGAQFARYVDSAVKSDQLLYRDAYQMLRMKGDSYNRLVTEFI